MNRIHGKKGIITFYIFWLFAALAFLIIAALASPLAVRVNTELYAAGDALMRDANVSLQGIENGEVRSELEQTFTEALAAEQDNIEINAQLFQYGWVIVLGLSSIVVFLAARRVVEYSGGGLV